MTASRLVAAIGAVVAIAPSPSRAEEPVSVALHVHGSFSEGDGSMEWHTDRARSVGVDAIWWTDHDWRIEGWNHSTGSGFEEATVDEEFGTVTEPDPGYPGETTQWVLVSGPRVGTVELATGFAREGKRSLRLTAVDDWNLPDYRPFHLRHGASRKQNRISLAARPRLSFSMHPDLLDPARDKFVLEVRLSEHPGDRPVLRYVAGSLDEEDFDVIALPLVPGEWNDYEVDLAADAITRLSAGGADSLRALDNSLVEVRIGVETRLGGTVTVHFDDFRIERDSGLSGDDLLARQREIAAFWESEYPDVRQFVGAEISRFRPQPHLVAYGPDRLPDYGAHGEEETLEWAVEQAHARGGVVSYAHAFGPWVFAFDDSEEARLGRIRDQTIGLVTSRLLGCDVFEVGYRLRGGASLDEHLAAWDALGANGIFVTGNGVNDSHGTDPFHGWLPWQNTIARMNNLVTWIWTDTVSEPALLHGLRGGRAFFGDPFEFAGSVELATAEGFPMGRIVLTDRASHDVDVRIEGVDAGDAVRLVQVEIRTTDPPGWMEPTVLRDEVLGGSGSSGTFDERVTVATGAPSLVRVELRDAAGQPLAFSNPLYFVRDVPKAGIAPERLAATIGDLRIERAQAFTLDGASLDAGARRLRISGRADATGGSLVVATGARAAATRVTGVDAWSWDDGLLTLAGFADGTPVEVSWGAPGPAPEPVRTLTLGPGRPRASGGVDATFGLPRRMRVRVAVFSVAGRRIRTLVDEVHDAGEHVATWDGRDARGDLVTSGIYFLRLDAGGKTLTARAVILR